MTNAGYQAIANGFLFEKAELAAPPADFLTEGPAKGALTCGPPYPVVGIEGAYADCSLASVEAPSAQLIGWKKDVGLPFLRKFDRLVQSPTPLWQQLKELSEDESRLSRALYLRSRQRDEQTEQAVNDALRKLEGAPVLQHTIPLGEGTETVTISCSYCSGERVVGVIQGPDKKRHERDFFSGVKKGGLGNPWQRMKTLISEYWNIP